MDVAAIDMPLPMEVPAVRINVDDFDEACKTLEEKGFRNAQGGHVTDTGFSRFTMMVSPSGFTIRIAEHIRNHD